MNTSTPERRDEIGAYFAANADRLHRAVRRTARAPEQTIEDACQAAWIVLLGRPDVTLDGHGFYWLATVATRQAWRMASKADETPVGSFQGGATGHDAEPMPEPAHPDDRSAEQRALARIEHDERVEVLGTLKPREREALMELGSAGGTAAFLSTEAKLTGEECARRRQGGGAPGARAMKRGVAMGRRRPRSCRGPAPW